MSSGPLISIIVNCYNGERFLAETLRSVLAQSYPRWELVFWDNRSTDGSAAVLKGFGEARFRYFLAEKHTSLGEARQLAVVQARGEWIAFLDCDDLWAPDKLASQVALIAAHDRGRLGLVYGRCKFLGGALDGEDTSRTFLDRPLPQGEILRAILLEEWFIPLVSALVKKRAFDEVGGIPADYFVAEDFYIFAAVCTRYEGRGVEDYICQARIHGNNLTHKHHLKMLRESLRVIQTFAPSVPGLVGEPAYQRRVQQLETKIALSLAVRERRPLAGLSHFVRRGDLAALLGIVRERWAAPAAKGSRPG